VLIGSLGLVELGVVAIAMLLGATIYESVVMAPNYERDIPESVMQARQFLRRRTPAHFFRVATPVAQVVLAGGTLASWQTPARWFLILALGILLFTDVVTFAFHYPRLRIMFKDPISADSEKVRSAAREWATGNLGRAVLLVLAILAAAYAASVLARGAYPRRLAE
jgi:hypothetical protein